jgi:uncharacterized protein
MNTDILEQTILWRRVDSPGYDACGLSSSTTAWRLAGTALFSFAGQPCKLCYEVDCDPSWRTRSARVTGWVGRTAVRFDIEALPGGHWSVNGTEQAELSGLVDVDLGFTPATNLIQLRRLALRVGQGMDAPAVYLNFPDLTLSRLEHHYHRLALNRYDYQAPGFNYAAILDVSDVGFVTRYPGLWEVEALR